jgi:hypothetical protein
MKKALLDNHLVTKSWIVIDVYRKRILNQNVGPFFHNRPTYSISHGLNLVKGADGSGLYWPDIENFLGVLLAVSPSSSQTSRCVFL